MFLIKSTFWLGLAFVIIQPTKIDFHSSKDALNNIAIETTKNIVASHVNSIECETIQCTGTKALILASNTIRTPNQALPMQEAQKQTKKQLIAPIPKPRLQRTG